MSKQEKMPPLEGGILTALRALDNQIARAMERSPSEREEHGVQKWEPYQQKVEQCAAIVLSAFAEDEIKLDSVLVAAQAFTKSLYLLSEELGEAGLGKVRTAYVKAALEMLIRDAERGLQGFEQDGLALN